MKLNSRMILSLLMAALLAVAIPQASTASKPKRGSSCTKPWKVTYEIGQNLNSGDLSRIKLRIKGDPFTDPQHSTINVSWKVKSSAYRICSSTARIKSGQQAIGCTKRRFSDRGWRIIGPGAGSCTYRARAGDGEIFTKLVVTAARRTQRR